MSVCSGQELANALYISSFFGKYAFTLWTWNTLVEKNDSPSLTNVADAAFTANFVHNNSADDGSDIVYLVS